VREDPDQHNNTICCGVPTMGHTSRSSSANALGAPQRDAAYTRLAESAAREAEINCNEAARRRAWREAARTHRLSHSTSIRLAEPPLSARLLVEQAREPQINQREAARTRGEAAPARRAEDDFIDARLTELQERERALADREKLIATLETLLDRSRQRLEERLEQLAERKAAFDPTPRLGAIRPPTGAVGYIGPERSSVVDDPVRQEPTIACGLTASTG